MKVKRKEDEERQEKEEENDDHHDGKKEGERKPLLDLSADPMTSPLAMEGGAMGEETGRRRGWGRGRGRRWRGRSFLLALGVVLALLIIMFFLDRGRGRNRSSFHPHHPSQQHSLASTNHDAKDVYAEITPPLTHLPSPVPNSTTPAPPPSIPYTKTAPLTSLSPLPIYHPSLPSSSSFDLISNTTNLLSLPSKSKQENPHPPEPPTPSTLANRPQNVTSKFSNSSTTLPSILRSLPLDLLPRNGNFSCPAISSTSPSYETLCVNGKILNLKDLSTWEEGRSVAYKEIFLSTRDPPPPAPGFGLGKVGGDKVYLDIVLIELRGGVEFFPAFVASIRNILHLYGGGQEEISLTLVYSHLHEDSGVMPLLREISFLALQPKVRYIPLKGSYTIAGYNILLTSPTFWKAFQAAYVLVTQTDVLILKTLKRDDRFFQFGYVGAPWDERHYLGKDGVPRVGNGGYSLRKLSVMRSIVEGESYTLEEDEKPIPEDVWFAARLGEGAVPSEEMALSFALEWFPPSQEASQAKDFLPTGVHQMEKLGETFGRGGDILRNYVTLFC